MKSMLVSAAAMPLWVCHPARPKRPIAVSLGWLQAVPPVIMRPIGATRTGAGPTAAGIMTGSDSIAIMTAEIIPTGLGRAWRGVPVTATE
jgi:hypothetical protein